MKITNVDNTGDEMPAPKAPTREKLGLAMSGGGFRAAFFHVGVLAQMARLGLLRHVEVISTVSGGSIVGALYYLHVKRLLEEKNDEKITDEDYLRILQELEVEFLRGVQRNIRLRTFLNPMKNLRMAFADYSRTDHIGELYDYYLYRAVFRPAKSTLIEMRELKIQPGGDKPDFSPLKDNADRANKVPILLINATTLNTGHNWRFEAVRMGEPPLDGAIQREIDKNLRLRRPPHYNDIIPKQQNIELGLAVAASACVPALFTPLAITDLYPDGIRVQLVDGGVHDNQGIEGLLDMECTRLVISDAAGQMDDEPEPSTRTLKVFSRSNNILMDRIREEELCTTLQTDNLRVAFMHLRKGLYGKSISWIGRDGKPAEEVQIERPPNSSSTSFGVAEEVQDLLSRIRTDLDSFTDVEAYSLMLDGYKMSEQELQQAEATKNLITPTTRSPQWHFPTIERFLLNPTPEYLRQLKVAQQNLFKIYKLSWPVTIVTLFVLLGVAGGLWYRFGEEFQSILATPVTIGYLLSMLVMTLLIMVTPFLSRTIRALRFLRAPSDLIFRFLVRAVFPALGFIFVILHLIVFDRLFLRRGKLGNL